MKNYIIAVTLYQVGLVLIYNTFQNTQFADTLFLMAILGCFIQLTIMAKHYGV